ncbi:phage holin [Jeotgalibacillus haloalkalitolerans]|uniref:Phage holin n=1 Tax=Jeotgalibacillus haloalkalitolerans TaxID=3104292 RepID=A0ABU5KM93_9BACL|nr:phage holin [Jeotgalibacillus sp. HH7-29]MDZ5712388.1 phage holin [Jeotgalibacillus sp. HH7-29]
METITVIRTITLVIALLNLSLVFAGYSPLPIEDEEIEQLVTLIFTIGASLWAWWKDNDISRKARERKNEEKTLRESPEYHPSDSESVKLLCSPKKEEIPNLQKAADSKTDMRVLIKHSSGEYEFVSIHQLVAGILVPRISAENMVDIADRTNQQQLTQ